MLSPKVRFFEHRSKSDCNDHIKDCAESKTKECRLSEMYLFTLPVLEKKLSDINNLMNAKEEKLRGRHKDTHTALLWLRENKLQFVGNVYEPMMLVVSPSQLFTGHFITTPLKLERHHSIMLNWNNYPLINQMSSFFRSV